MGNGEEWNEKGGYVILNDIQISEPESKCNGSFDNTSKPRYSANLILDYVCSVKLIPYRSIGSLMISMYIQIALLLPL